MRMRSENAPWRCAFSQPGRSTVFDAPSSARRELVRLMWTIRARRYKTSGGRKETAAAAKQITGGKKKRGGKKSEPSKDDVRQMFDEIDGKY